MSAPSWKLVSGCVFAAFNVTKDERFVSGYVFVAFNVT